jgi:hypothetical protein
MNKRGFAAEGRKPPEGGFLPSAPEGCIHPNNLVSYI